jgi:hypothetical protein
LMTGITVAGSAPADNAVRAGPGRRIRRAAVENTPRGQRPIVGGCEVGDRAFLGHHPPQRRPD